MNAESLRDLFVDELKDVYNAEKQLIRALPKMARAASNPQLRKAFEQHLRQTEGHAGRLERIFKDLGTPARGKPCKGVERYEIAAYGCVRSYAELLGYNQAAKLLQQTLSEEEAADERLNRLAEGGINQAAASVAGEELDEE